MTFPAPQEKPAPRLNYYERCRAKLVAFKPRSRLRKVAKGNEARMRKYKRWVSGMMFGAKCCFHGCGRIVGLEPHHPHGRTGENLFKVTALCHDHHAWIHAHPDAAFNAGWLTPIYRGYAPNPSHPQPFTLLPYP